MSAFRDLKPEGHLPSKVVVVPRSAFNAEWEERPVSDAKMGLRLLSEKDVRDAHVISIAYARRVCDDLDERRGIYADYLVRLAVARGTTNPNDAREPYFGAMAEDMVAVAMTPDGMLRVYEELVLHTSEQSPLLDDVTDEEIYDALERLDDAPEPVRARLRRVLGYVVRALTEAGY